MSKTVFVRVSNGLRARSRLDTIGFLIEEQERGTRIEKEKEEIRRKEEESRA